jgi:hypothetical protein
MPGELEMNSSNSHFSPDILSKGTFDGYATNAHFVPMLLIENMKRVRWHGSLPYSSLTISLMNQFFFVQLLDYFPNEPILLCTAPWPPSRYCLQTRESMPRPTSTKLSQPP